MQAVTEIQTNQTSQDVDGDDISDAKIILLLSIHYSVLIIVWIFFLILVAARYRNNPI
jgi:hypothetical protein